MGVLTPLLAVLIGWFLLLRSALIWSHFLAIFAVLNLRCQMRFRMKRFPSVLYLVGHKSASGLDQYLGVFVSLQYARDVFRSLAQTDDTVYLVRVKVQL